MAVTLLDGEETDAMRELLLPSAQVIEQEIAAYRSGWVGQNQHRWPTSFMMQTEGLMITLPFCGGMMLAGMALLAGGRLTEPPPVVYAAILLGVGLLLTVAGAVLAADEPDPLKATLLRVTLHQLSSPLVAVGYAWVILRAGVPGAVGRILAKLGRTSFSNYLLQTLLCTTLFYGHGLGLFGYIRPSGLILLAGGIWLVQILLTTLWLRHFNRGPMEHLLRRLVYRREAC